MIPFIAGFARPILHFQKRKSFLNKREALLNVCGKPAANSSTRMHRSERDRNSIRYGGNSISPTVCTTRAFHWSREQIGYIKDQAVRIYSPRILAFGSKP